MTDRCGVFPPVEHGAADRRQTQRVLGIRSRSVHQQLTRHLRVPEEGRVMQCRPPEETWSNVPVYVCAGMCVMILCMYVSVCEYPKNAA